MTEPLTIESFFLSDYAKVKARNEELENEIREAKEKYNAQLPETGFVDLRTQINLVRVDTECSDYRLFKMSDAPLKDLNSEQLKNLLEMDNDRLLEKMKNVKSSYCGYAIEVKEKKFPFTVKFSSYKGTKIYAYDPDYNNDELVEFLDSEAGLDCWVVSDLKEECIRYALEEVREKLKGRIEELESRSQEGDDND